MSSNTSLFNDNNQSDQDQLDQSNLSAQSDQDQIDQSDQDQIDQSDQDQSDPDTETECQELTNSSGFNMALYKKYKKVKINSNKNKQYHDNHKMIRDKYEEILENKINELRKIYRKQFKEEINQTFNESHEFLLDIERLEDESVTNMYDIFEDTFASSCDDYSGEDSDDIKDYNKDLKYNVTYEKDKKSYKQPYIIDYLKSHKSKFISDDLFNISIKKKLSYIHKNIYDYIYEKYSDGDLSYISEYIDEISYAYKTYFKKWFRSTLNIDANRQIKKSYRSIQHLIKEDNLKSTEEEQPYRYCYKVIDTYLNEEFDDLTDKLTN